MTYDTNRAFILMKGEEYLEKMLFNFTQEIKDSIKEVKKENCDDHEQINGHLARLNGQIIKIKKNQLLLRGILIGAAVILFVLGLLPQRSFDLLKMLI